MQSSIDAAIMVFCWIAAAAAYNRKKDEIAMPPEKTSSLPEKIQIRLRPEQAIELIALCDRLNISWGDAQKAILDLGRAAFIRELLEATPNFDSAKNLIFSNNEAILSRVSWLEEAVREIRIMTPLVGNCIKVLNHSFYFLAAAGLPIIDQGYMDYIKVLKKNADDSIVFYRIVGNWKKEDPARLRSSVFVLSSHGLPTLVQEHDYCPPKEIGLDMISENAFISWPGPEPLKGKHIYSL